MPDSSKRGFSSAAGLIQYYDMEESKALKIDPYIVVILGLGAAVVVEILSWKVVLSAHSPITFTMMRLRRWPSNSA